MKIFHIKSSDCTMQATHRFADLVCALASIGIKQHVLMSADPHLESQFIDMEISFDVQKFGGLFDLRTQQAAQHIAGSFGPHIIQTHSPNSASVIAKLNHDALRIGFAHENEDTNKKILVNNNIMLATDYASFGGPLDYNILSVPPLVFNPGPDVIPAERDLFDTPPDVPLLGTMIDFSEDYDIPTILAALRGIEEAHLWLIGQGPAKTIFMDKARKQAVHDRVRIIEDVSNWPSLLKALDLCVVPLRSNATDRLTLEAWACAVPVLSSMPAEHTPIADSTNGWLLEKNDVICWRDTIKTLLADEDQLAAIGSAGQQAYQKSYEATQIVRRYLQSYETGLRIAV